MKLNGNTITIDLKVDPVIAELVALKDETNKLALRVWDAQEREEAIPAFNDEELDDLLDFIDNKLEEAYWGLNRADRRLEDLIAKLHDLNK